MDVTDGPIRSANFVLEPIPRSLPLSPSSPLLRWDRLCLPVRSCRARSSENVQKQRCRSIRGGVSSRSVPENGIIQSVFERLSVCRNPDCRTRKSARDCLTYFWFDRFLFLKRRIPWQRVSKGLNNFESNGLIDLFTWIGILFTEPIDGLKKITRVN